MGNDQSKANGYHVCRAGLIVSDGKSTRQLVDIQKDTSYTNHDVQSMRTMMTRDIQLVARQFLMAVSTVDTLAEQDAKRHDNRATHK